MTLTNISTVMGQICSFLWTRKLQKTFSFRGLLTPHRGWALLRWGLCLHTAVIGSRCALSMASEPCHGLVITKAGSATAVVANFAISVEIVVLYTYIYAPLLIAQRAQLPVPISFISDVEFQAFHRLLTSSL